MNTRADGGVGYQAITDADECLAECLDTADCVGVDIDLRSARTLCWLHLDVDNLDTAYSFDGVNHWVLEDRCPPVGE